jgi:hypothetical protein
MKNSKIFFIALFTFVSFDIIAQCALACPADFFVSLDINGNASLTAEDVLVSYGPSCGTLVLEPSTFDCSDIGAPVPYTVTDLATGNTCFGNIHVRYNVGPMACLSNISVVLPPSGELTLTPELMLIEPSPECLPGAIITPPTVSCADIGSPVLVSVADPVSGNSCFSNVTVSYNVGAMSCFANVNVQLDATGSRTLTSDLLLFDPPGACIPGAIINPSNVSCSDAGSTVVVTITDPVSGNSCWSNVTVDDPRPSSCNIVVPSPIYCGDSGVMISANVSGGYGPYTYEWTIKGNPNGWSILSGQGSDIITMAVGDKKINLELTVTGICGKKTKCKVKLDCEDPPAFEGADHMTLAPSKPFGFDQEVKVYPNPATDILNVRVSNSGSFKYHVVDQFGRSHRSAMIGGPKESVIEINVDGLSQGVYWLVIEDTKAKIKVRKFVKVDEL